MPESDPRRLLARIAKILKRLEIPYLITGGIAVLVWGRPRFTADIDIVVEIGEMGITKFALALKGLGKFGYVDEKMMRDAIRREDEFNFIDGNTGVKVNFWVWRKNDPFDVSRLQRRVAKKVLGETIYFTSPEDLILIKLRWYKDSLSSRQLEDVESIIKISGKKLDWIYLESWAKKLKCWDLLVRLKKPSLPKPLRSTKTTNSNISTASSFPYKL